MTPLIPRTGPLKSGAGKEDPRFQAALRIDPLNGLYERLQNPTGRGIGGRCQLEREFCS